MLLSKALPAYTRGQGDTTLVWWSLPEVQWPTNSPDLTALKSARLSRFLSNAQGIQRLAFVTYQNSRQFFFTAWLMKYRLTTQLPRVTSYIHLHCAAYWNTSTFKLL